VASEPMTKSSAPPPLGVLMVLANPVDLPRYDDGRIWQDVADGLEPFRASGSVRLARLDVPTEEALEEQLARNPWHVLHFVVHARELRGSGHGTIALHAFDRTARKVSGSRLAKLVAKNPSLRLIVLQACDDASYDFAAVVEALVARGLTAVVAPPFDGKAQRIFVSTLSAGALAGLSADDLCKELQTALDGVGARLGAVRVAAKDSRQPVSPDGTEEPVVTPEQGVSAMAPVVHTPRQVAPTLTPTLSSLRRLMSIVLRGDADLEAFCLDYFSRTHSRFSGGMDRVQKTTLLLQYEEPSTILVQLREHDPEAVARHEALLQYE
jgi:hypothetical protein